MAFKLRNLFNTNKQFTSCLGTDVKHYISTINRAQCKPWLLKPWQWSLVPVHTNSFSFGRLIQNDHLVPISWSHWFSIELQQINVAIGCNGWGNYAQSFEHGILHGIKRLNEKLNGTWFIYLFAWKWKLNSNNAIHLEIVVGWEIERKNWNMHFIFGISIRRT